MIVHIVRYNETINDIINMYHVDLDEIKENNAHITDFSNLVSGSKIMVPLINREVEQILEKTECFVEDYYPKISEEIILELNKNFEKKEENIVLNKVENTNLENEIRRAYPGIIPPKKPYKGI